MTSPRCRPTIADASTRGRHPPAPISFGLGGRLDLLRQPLQVLHAADDAFLDSCVKRFIRSCGQTPMRRAPSSPLQPGTWRRRWSSSRRHRSLEDRSSTARKIGDWRACFEEPQVGGKWTGSSKKSASPRHSEVRGTVPGVGLCAASAHLRGSGGLRSGSSPPGGRSAPSDTDAARMLESYFSMELRASEREARAHAKAALNWRSRSNTTAADFRMARSAPRRRLRVNIVASWAAPRAGRSISAFGDADEIIRCTTASRPPRRTTRAGNWRGTAARASGRRRHDPTSRSARPAVRAVRRSALDRRARPDEPFR